jgi:hypothetical protein
MTRDVLRLRASVLFVVSLFCLIMFWAPAPVWADHDQEQHLAVTSPPAPPKDWLGRNVPGLDERRNTWPAFFRDTDVNVHFRTFYFNRQKSDDTASEAWALGGWVQYLSGWLWDTFSIGATYYTSLPAYAPDDRPGSLILTPGQDAIGTFGEAWARCATRNTRCCAAAARRSTAATSTCRTIA